MPRSSWLCVFLCAASVLAGCAPLARSEDVLLIRGELTYRERIALPADGYVVVELSRPQDGRVIADQQIPLNGRQVPIRFELRVQRAAMAGDAVYALRGTVQVRGRPAWSSDPVDVRAGAGPIDAGTLMLRPWDEAAATSHLRARGNEPSWRLDLGTALVFETLDGRIEGTAPPARVIDGVRTHAGTVGGRSIRVALTPRVCRDTMSGMPHPWTAEVVVDGRTYRGCGGDPESLLVGSEWTVEGIDGRMIDRSRATLDFGVDGRLAGKASCNAYTTSFTLTGEALAIGATATTRMSCAPALMEQEQLFLDVLQRVRTFDVDDTGALVLQDDRGRRITARRPR